MQVSVDVAAEARAAAIAREVVSGALVKLPIPEARIEDLRLLTSEVVTNAVRHAGLTEEDTIRLVMVISDRRVRVEVVDRGPGFDPQVVEGPDPEQLSGFGLHLVKQLADRWGVVRDDGNLVWFEMTL